MEERTTERNDLQETVDKAVAEMAEAAGVDRLAADEVNLAELQRRTGLTRSKARTLRAKGFRVTPHGRTGQRARTTVMSGHEQVADALLAKGVTNSSVVYDRLREDGDGGAASAP